MKSNIKDVLQIKNSTDNSVDLYFYGEIVSDSWSAWEYEDQYPDAIANLLKGQEGKSINIYINSCGGDVFAGIAIYNILKRHKGYKTVYIDGIAASIASVIALAGDKVIIPSNAFFMIHKPWTYFEGNANKIREIADRLDVLEKGMLKIYEENLIDGVTIDTIAEMLNAETWLTGEQAAEYFKVEVSAEQKISACATKMHFKNAPKNLFNISQKNENENKTKTAEKIKSTAAKLKSLCISEITKGAQNYEFKRNEGKTY